MLIKKFEINICMTFNLWLCSSSDESDSSDVDVDLAADDDDDDDDEPKFGKKKTVILKVKGTARR